MTRARRGQTWASPFAHVRPEKNVGKDAGNLIGIAHVAHVAHVVFQQGSSTNVGKRGQDQGPTRAAAGSAAAAPPLPREWPILAAPMIDFVAAFDGAGHTNRAEPEANR